jgi:2-polyprenyl-3-methyl-5-hydroxy-6-metoxy-1,4-benzoquinol methylase
MASVDTAYFDGLYRRSADPWSLGSRWYEARKRALLLACLPRERIGSVFEPGCAGGDLTVQLAGRADRVLAMDLNARAVDHAIARTTGLANVEVRQGMLPEDWPAEHFDVIVLSEIAYYFTHDAWAGIVQLCVSSLKPEGTLLACHWLPDFDARVQSTVAAHAALGSRRELFAQVDHVEKDFIVQSWSRADVSVAQREGLT